jgi:hypothetical protein
MSIVSSRYLRNIDQFFPVIQRQKFGFDQSDLKMESALKVYIRQQQEACSKISQLKLHVTIRFTKNKNHEHGIKSICRRTSGNTQIVIPRNLIPRVLGKMHKDLRHFGFKKTSKGPLHY